MSTDPPPSEGASPPSPTRVAERFLVLVAIHVRARLELVRDDAVNREAERTKLLDWMTRGRFGHEFEEDERSLHIPCGGLDRTTAITHWWRGEGAVVLAWALHLAGPPADRPSDRAEELADLGGFPEGVPANFVEGATLRTPDELAAMRNHQFFWHWRFADFRLTPRSMKFATVGKRAPFGRFGPHEFSLVDGDLAVGGAPISKATPELVAAHESTAAERHRAANWLLGGGAYGATSIDT